MHKLAWACLDFFSVGRHVGLSSNTNISASESDVSSINLVQIYLLFMKKVNVFVATCAYPIVGNAKQFYVVF